MICRVEFPEDGEVYEFDTARGTVLILDTMAGRITSVIACTIAELRSALIREQARRAA